MPTRVGDGHWWFFELFRLLLLSPDWGGYSRQTIHEMAWACDSNGPDTISSPKPLRLCKRPDTKKDGSTQKSRLTCEVNAYGLTDT